MATVFNMNALQGGSVGDVSLDAIAVMAQAQGENGDGNGDSDFAAERKYVSESGYVDCLKSNGAAGTRSVTIMGYVCIGEGNLACVTSLTYSYTSNCQ